MGITCFNFCSEIRASEIATFTLLNFQFFWFFHSQICSLPSYTKEKDRITIFRLIDEDPNQYDPVSFYKMVFMLSDVRYITPDPIGLTEGEIGIMDFKGFTFRHFLKVATNFSTTRLYLKYVQEAVPFKIRQNHFVNCSPSLSRIMTLIRPFVKKELFDAMHFHPAGYESLYEFIPREKLPLEYGGDAGKIDEIFAQCLKVVESQKEYLSDDNNWKLSE